MKKIHKMNILVLLLLIHLYAGCSAHVQGQSPSSADIVSTREMERINWMEFREVVPARITTVLLPTGTLEPHGVINNGADNTAPSAIARHIAKGTNAMTAPTLPYGITGSLEAYPGAFQISESAYRPFVFDQKKADEYFNKVTEKVAGLINEVIRKWDMAGL